MTTYKRYDPLSADLPHTPMEYPDTYWWATANTAPSDDGKLSENIDTDVAIIGAGYTGLSCAYYLAKKYGVRVHVLEAHKLGWGCSGRNGSFMRPAIGRFLWSEYLKKYGLNQTRSLFQESFKALNTMKELIELGSIECDKQPDGWLRVAHNKNRWCVLEREYKVLQQYLGYKEVSLLSDAEVTAHGLGGTEAHGAIYYPHAFSAHPLKVAFGIAKMAREAGATIHTATPVTRWDQNYNQHRLITPHGVVNAKHVVIATNGYSTEKLHPSLKARLMPVLSSIVVTRPFSPDELIKAGFTTTNIVIDTRKLLNFYRLLPDGRILLGSRGSITESPKDDFRISNDLLNTIKYKFPKLNDVRADYHWSGWVALSFDSMPRVHSLKSHTGVSYAIGYNGSGTTASVYFGKLLAEHIGGGVQIPEVLGGPLSAFPFSRFRRVGQRLAFAAFKYQDKK